MANKQWTTPLPFYNLLLLIIIAKSRLKQNLYKKCQQLTCSWFSSDSYDAFPSSDSMTSPWFWQNHTFILNTIHLLYVTLTPPPPPPPPPPTPRALILKRTHIRMKENPEITVQFYLKWRYILLYLDYKCKTLSFVGQDGNGLQLEKIGQLFQV